MSRQENRILLTGRGFTLIETLVYLALYALMFSGALAAVYTVIESSARDATSAVIEEEGEYLLAKIDGESAQAREITSSLGTSTSLSLVGTDGTDAEFTKCGTGLCLRDGSMPLERLNDPDTVVTALAFFVSADPETSIVTAFTITGTTTDGHSLSRDFYSVEYLHL